MIQKLIDAYELEREMYRRCIDTDIEIEKGRAKWDSGLWIRYKVFEDAITVASRVEAEPIKHGKWIEPEDITCYKCSVCKKYVTQEYGLTEPIFWHYCPHCGALMINENEEMSKVSEMEMAYGEYLND